MSPSEHPGARNVRPLDQGQDQTPADDTTFIRDLLLRKSVWVDGNGLKESHLVHDVPLILPAITQWVIARSVANELIDSVLVLDKSFESSLLTRVLEETAFAGRFSHYISACRTVIETCGHAAKQAGVSGAAAKKGLEYIGKISAEMKIDAELEQLRELRILSFHDGELVLGASFILEERFADRPQGVEQILIQTPLGDLDPRLLFDSVSRVVVRVAQDIHQVRADGSPTGDAGCLECTGDTTEGREAVSDYWCDAPSLFGQHKERDSYPDLWEEDETLSLILRPRRRRRRLLDLGRTVPGADEQA